MELQRQASARNGRADSARRVRLMLLLAEGCTWAEIRAKLDRGDSYINRWSKRFVAERMASLFARHSGRRRYKVSERLEARVLDWTPPSASRPTARRTGLRASLRLNWAAASCT
jgi:transposase